MNFINKVSLLSFFIYAIFFTICYPVHAGETRKMPSCLTVGIGWEKLIYKEKVPELSILTSDTKVDNLVLYFAGTMTLNRYFVGFKGALPVIYGDTTEYWKESGQNVQANSFTYRRTNVDALFGFSVSQFINPYIGTGWTYSHQKRYDFHTLNTPGAVPTSISETVHSLSLLLGLRGAIPLKEKWLFTYSIEYSLPYYANVENSYFAGWEPTNIDGYSYSVTGQFEYLIAAKTALIVRTVGGKQYWEGSDWEKVNNSRVKWPENETTFLGGFVNFKKHF